MLVDSVPVYLGGVATPSGTKNLLFVVTTGGALLALDAANGSTLWQQQPTGRGTLTNGSPAIDPNRMFVYAYGLDGYVHKYGTADGTEIRTNGWPELATSKPNVEKAASALAIASPAGGDSFLYSTTNGYFGDQNDYQGHVTAINLRTGNQTVFNTLCSNSSSHFVEIESGFGPNDCFFPDRSAMRGSGIWGRPGVVYDSGLNRIFFATGNGAFAANAWGDSVLALNPDGTGLNAAQGLPLDSYTPTEFATPYPGDTDVGSTSPAILPSTSSQYPHLAVQSGKDGCVRLLDLDDLSGRGGPGNSGGELNSAGTGSCPDALNAEVLTQPAVWVSPTDGSTHFFIAAGTGLFAYRLAFNGSGYPTLGPPTRIGQGGTSPAIANNQIYYLTNDRKISVIDAATGNAVWSSSGGGGKSIGPTHWQSPIVVDGHVYFVDGNDPQIGGASTIWAFALDGNIIFQDGFEQ
ncbi:MAG TPA: PQQ-binding-like beta-propeller repeat protein [Rudaea sp.]|nr:PQQ-binding-like beta-propeller repeat protein [Rudaea sp.]